MASTYLDEFVVNFDLNHLSTEENIQPSKQKYDKLRKSVSWLKSRIISTDFAIQKFQAKKEDLELSVKAHSVTREELKQVCINYKDASEKCTILENENKTLLANQDILKERLIGVETKYEALISHTNQLQMLIKQLEHEKDVLTVEKELNKSNNKDGSQITELHNDKNEMRRDLIALKDVILGKKKASKRHFNILKKYVKNVKYKEPKILCTSEESGDDIDNYSSPNVLKILDEVHNGTDDELISSVEQSFRDNCSDGQLSVDTGRGSSRANSHDKYLSSPDYVLNLDNLVKSPIDVIKTVDAANSPITVCSTRSIATSPVVFDDPTPLFEDHYDYADHVDSAEYNVDDISLSQEIEELVEQEKLADCASPEPDMSELIDTKIKNCKYIIIKESDIKPSNKSLFEPIDDNETSNFVQDTSHEPIPNCKCNQSDILMGNDRRTLTDSSTSPLPMSKLVNIGINTDESVNVRKSTVDVATNTINGLDNEDQNSLNSGRNPTNNIEIIENKVVNTNTSTNLKATLVVSDIKTSVHNKQQSAKSISPKESKNNINQKEKIRNQEKVCLESNSSKKLHFTSSNDTEVQNILNVMKMRHDLISPISETPFDSEYLRLIPEMNDKLGKIWSTIENIYKMPNPLRNNNRMSQNSTEINNFKEVSETEIIESQTNSHKQQSGCSKSSNQIEDDDLIDTSRLYVEKSSMSPDNTFSECLRPVSKKADLIKLNPNKSGLFDNTFLPHRGTNPIIVISEEIESKPEQEKIVNSFDNVCKDNVNNTNKTSHTISMAENDKEEDSQQPNYYESNDHCDVNTDNTTDTANIPETRTAHTIIINGTKTKKRSKLDKLRDKLRPTCKIKKVKSPVKKPAPKTYVKPNNTALSSSLKQKLAYENAVKVMAELRSNQELQDKKKQMKSISKDINSESRLNKIKSPPGETGISNVLSTRSSKRLRKKEKDTSITTNPEKSPISRNLRKRPADTDLDILRNSSKRILRSSNVSQVISEKVLSEFQKDSVTEQLYYDFEDDSDCKNTAKSVCDSNNSLSKCSKSINDNAGGNSNVDNNDGNCQIENTEAVDCDITLEKSVRMKPVIELSECLTDNANVVSIIPGNVGYLDVNKNINPTNKSAKSNIDMLDKQNDQQHSEKHNDEMAVDKVMESSETDNCVKQGIDITKISEVKETESLMNSRDSESIGNEYSNNVQDDNASVQTSPRSPKQSLQAQHNGITNIKQNTTTFLEDKLREKANIGTKNPIVQLIPLKNERTAYKKDIVSYDDLELYTDDSKVVDNKSNTPPNDNQRRKENILCTALDRYGVISVKYVAKKVPDAITLKISQKIEESITKIIASPKAEQKRKMDDLVTQIQSFKTKQILAGLMKYLKDPTRKNELFNKIVNGPAPPMTKSEVILLYVVESLNASLPSGFITRLWNNMEHALFQLNHAPEFDVIESLSHFYAVLCRYFRNKSRLRCFMLDAMYCLQFKAVPLIRQCLDVCPGVLPNAHERMAKTSLVTCLVYLLHFYKCEDKFNRAQDIRNILNRKYHYRFSEWNETMILEIFRKAIMDLRGTHNDKKMLRVALIILCKRHGAKWCQLNIIQNILLPIVEKKDVPDRIKQFCVLMLGPLLKPFPADRKAQCEIVINQLLQMLKQNASHEMKEAIYSSLIFMNKHDQERVVQALLTWNPEKVSPEFEEILNDYVMDKPLGVWKKLVSRKPSQCT